MFIKNTIHTAWSSYVSMGSTIITALLTIRLATNALTPEEFGLWSFTTQSVGYFLLLDLGVSNSLGRLFGEPLASGNQGKINQIFTLSSIILIIQGLLIFGIGLAMRDWVIDWFEIPLNLREDASRLWLAFLLIQSVNLPLRLSSAILYAQNRQYWSNLFPALSTWFGLGGFYWMLEHGWGVMSYALSSGLGIAIAGIASLIALRAGPNRFRYCIRGLEWMQVKDMFRYSTWMFVISLTIQITFMGQALIVTKILGLAAGSAYSVTSRIPMMCMGIVWKPFDSFHPRWQSLYCNGNTEKVRIEFSTMFRITLLLTVIAMVGTIIVNPLFVKSWTKPEYYGGDALNIVLALYVLSATFTHCYSPLFNLFKKMNTYTIMSVLSALTALALMIFFVPKFGLVAVPASLIIGDLCFALWYCVLVGGRLCGIKTSSIVRNDIIVTIPPLVAVGLFTAYLSGPFTSNSFYAFVCAFLISMLLSLPALLRLTQLFREMWAKRSSSSLI